ncbi:MAG: PilZ domain-containing protein [Candidatus Methylomirabilota bacterium]
MPPQRNGAVHNPRRERAAETSQGQRRVPRFRIPARPRGRVLEILEFQLLDLSVAGARIGHQDPLRVGSVWTFELPKMFRSLILPARVVHSTAVTGAKLRESSRGFPYESGVEFVGITPEQQAVLEQDLKPFASSRADPMISPREKGGRGNPGD